MTLSEIVHRAVEVVDPDGGEGLDDLLERFEDADEPLSSVGADSVAQRIAEGIGALDPQEEDGAVQMAGAVATYLAYRRDQVYEDPGALLFKGTHRGTLSARICGRCGYTELYVSNPQELLAAYRRNRKP